jgi:hypothetical protein
MVADCYIFGTMCLLKTNYGDFLCLDPIKYIWPLFSIWKKTPYNILDLTVYEQRLTLVCLYGYNTDKPELFTEILQKSAEFANTSFLFCGDWNVVQNKSDDTYNVIHDRN